MVPKRHINMDSLRRCVRSMICTSCYQRPPGSERLGNAVPRACEGQCPLFLHLPKLYRIAVHNNTAEPGACEREVRQTICAQCTRNPTGDEHCPEFEHRTCPLSRFHGETVAIIETLREWERRRLAI